MQMRKVITEELKRFRQSNRMISNSPPVKFVINWFVDPQQARVCVPVPVPALAPLLLAFNKKFPLAPS